MSEIGSYSGKKINSQAAVAPTLDLSGIFNQSYNGKVDYENQSIQANKATSLDLSGFLDEDYEQSEVVLKEQPPVETITEYIEPVNQTLVSDNKNIFEKTLDFLTKSGAALCVGTTTTLLGGTEAIIDGGTWILSELVGLVSEEKKEKMQQFIKEDYLVQANNNLYEKNELFSNINEHSYLKYDGTVDNQVLEGFENTSNIIKKSGATVAVTVTSLLSGTASVLESITDGAEWLVADIWEKFDEEVGKQIKEEIAEDSVNKENEHFYENTELGRTLNDLSYLKYDSKEAKTLQSISEKVTVFATATAATVSTGGIALAAGGLGFAYGLGNAAENTYATKGTDTSVLDELLIIANGGLSALSWYTSGRLGKGFVEIGKSMSESSFNEVIAQMAKDIFSKDMLKELLQPSNIVGNAIATLMQTGGDIGLIATKLYNGQEVTSEEWNILVLELIAYFGLNMVEDALMTEIAGFKSNEKVFDAEFEIIDDAEEVSSFIALDLAAKELVDFSEKSFISKEFFFTEKGQLLLDSYEALKHITFDEFNALYPGKFLYEDDFFEAIGTIKSEYNRAVYRLLYSGEESLEPNKIHAIEDYLFSELKNDNIPGNYMDFINQHFEHFRSLVEKNNYTVNEAYREVYNQLCKRMALINTNYHQRVIDRLEDFSNGYVPKERIDSIRDSFVFEVDPIFFKNAPENAAGYNNGNHSVINLKYTMDEIEDIMNHESMHQISHRKNYFDNGDIKEILSGVQKREYEIITDENRVILGGEWKTRRKGINESITEFLQQKSYGDGYTKSFTSGYQDGVDILSSYVDNGIVTVEDLKKFYFTNDGEGLVKLFDDLADRHHLSIRGEDIISAFDSVTLSEGDIAGATKVLNKFLKDYKKANSSLLTNIFDELQELLNQ